MIKYNGRYSLSFALSRIVGPIFSRLFIPCRIRSPMFKDLEAPRDGVGDVFRIVKPVVIACALLMRADSTRASAANELLRHPIVGQQSLADNYVRDSYGADAARLYARYSALLIGAGGLSEKNISLWHEVIRINPKLFLALQWPVRSQSSCDAEASAAGFEAHVAALGTFKAELDSVELDGTGGFAVACGQDAFRRLVDRFRAALEKLGIDPMLTINGASFPYDERACGYSARFGTGGGRIADLPKLINGSLEEGWTSRGLANGNLQRARARVAEACSWIHKAQSPSMVWAFDETPTPWWNSPARSPSTWSDMRLGFAAAQMYDRIVYIYNPTKKGTMDREINPERLFWGDYYAVDLRSGRVPSYGSDRIRSRDDDLDHQLASTGYLGTALAKASITPVTGGIVMQREFQCGYVYANLSPTDYPDIAPSVPTQRVAGTQDSTYDDGSTSRNYVLPARDGLVLLKQSCIGTDGKTR